MTTEREHLARADNADAILSHPLISEALDSYEKDLTEAWKTSKNGDREGREKLHQMLQAAAHFRAYLQQTVTTGKLIRAKVKPAPMDRLRRVVGL
jgi:hypothetical protein